MAAQPRPRPKLQPDPNSPLASMPLIPEGEFHDKLKAIFSVPKRELDELVKAHPMPAQKRGRKARG